MEAMFSICIPSYNRARHLPPLLDSIFSQDFDSFEVVICEDASPERASIADVVRRYREIHKNRLRYIENETNLGYDANIRKLIDVAEGRFCFFMGNDDILAPGALRHTADVIQRHPGIALVLKSYAWFDKVPESINQEVRYFSEERVLEAGIEAVSVCFRRSGVISGYVVDRALAKEAATAKFDGTLYYQLHLSAAVLATHSAVFTPRVLVLCRNGEPPDFGNSSSEKGKFVPGRYTPEARLRMIGGAVAIVKDLKAKGTLDAVEPVLRDYANYFYPYIRDQLNLPVRAYYKLYRDFGRMGFARFPLFHVYFFIAYILGEARFDFVTRALRRALGRSPQFRISRRSRSVQ